VFCVITLSIRCSEGQIVTRRIGNPFSEKENPHLATKTPVTGEFFYNGSGGTYLTALYCIVL
jgi:hypothetical protein